MVAPRGRRIVAGYRTTLDRTRQQVVAAARREYAGIDVDDIAGSVDRYIARAAPIVAGGQRTVQSLTRGYLRSYGLAATGSLLELDDAPDLAGTTRAGEPLTSGMAAWGPMILAQIADGRSPLDALEYGGYIVERFVDGELTGVADRELEVQGERVTELVGWEGIVSPDACDLCQENAGVHELTWRSYRHGSCNCETVPVFAPR